MRTQLLLAVVAILLAAAGPAAGETLPALAEPFKLGTFEIEGEPAVGIVLRDRFVVLLNAANRDLERRPDVVKMPMPKDMKQLAGLYHIGMNRRIYDIVNYVLGEKLFEGAARRYYVHDADKVRTLAPLLYPGKILNAAGNYYGHVGEAGTPEEQKKIAEERRKDRGMPYLFLKATTNAVIGNGDAIRIPRGRPKLDWECELAAVIGQPAKYATVARAKDHIFGYTIELDMSDRGGRGDAEPRFGGSDWLIGKGHDTFAPMGPFIVPAEFIKDPMNLFQKLTVNGKLMQDSRSSDMIHNVYELIEYGSSVLTLESGDVISCGSPAGTGISRSVRPEQVFLKPGDMVVATIEGIGTLTHPVKADDAAPAVTTTTSK